MENRHAEIFENFFLPKDDHSALPTSPGLILFADDNDKPIQLLTTANIRNAVKNKLIEQTEKSKRTDLKEITAKIYYSVCQCRFRLAMKHLCAVRKIFSENYKDHITLVQPWFVRVNFADKTPFFSITKKPSFKTDEKILCPFPSQKSATDFLKAIQDIFKLCKRPDIANNPELAKSCPYLQMDSCCGLCAGRISSDEYLQITKKAFSAGANPSGEVEILQRQMTEAAKNLNFELAAELKKKIEKLSVLKKQTYRWTSDLEKLKIVHIDKSARIKQQGIRAKKQTLAAFVMNCFDIIDLGDFLEDEQDKISQAIENALCRLKNDFDEIETLEKFSIISYFLYRTGSTGLWLKK
ncbi:MAG: UvrB/UvrC motif-containing protein [Phycisphaerae bacterium]|jgi:excinuclease UvrABC nuclease subunit